MGVSKALQSDKIAIDGATMDKFAVDLKGSLSCLIIKHAKEWLEKKNKVENIGRAHNVTGVFSPLRLRALATLPFL